MQFILLKKKYLEFWEKRYGEKCFLKFHGKQRIQAKEISDALGFREVLNRLENYFDDNSKWLVEHKHPFPVFFTSVNQYAKVVSIGYAKHNSFDASEQNKKEKLRRGR